MKGKIKGRGQTKKWRMIVKESSRNVEYIIVPPRSKIIKTKRGFRILKSKKRRKSK